MKLVVKEIETNKKDIKEKSFKAISFGLTNKKGEIYLTEDSDYPRSHDVSIVEGENLTDSELKFLVKSVIDYIPEGHYILSCGEHWEQKERMYKIFESLLKDTTCIRTLKDREGREHYYSILRK